MENIQKLHDDVFNFLNNWSEQSRVNNDQINPYFYMRSIRDERFRKGYWFPGNDSYMCISFWSGGDSNNKTPNIYFEISDRDGCRVIVVAKDSDSKFGYFKRMTSSMTEEGETYIPHPKVNVLVKKFTKNYRDWQGSLERFIHTDKRLIDEFIAKNELTEIEEFVSKFGFIDPKDFDTMYSKVLKERDLLKEAEKNKHREFLSNPKLPFALMGINIENFQGIKSTGVNDLKPDARWIFITGENGYGKTTILQAIALGLSGDPDLEKYLEEKTRISIELTTQNEKAFPVRTKGNISKTENYDFGQYILGYGPARLNVQSKASENMERKSTNNVLSLFDNETLLKNINYELFATNFSDEKTYKELSKLIKTVTKGRISEIKINEREAQFVETLSNGDKLEPMPLMKLAAGFRSIINIVIDIYLRFKKVHINLEYHDFYGIVLIDEIENHLHPILQRELPITLSEVFPNIQFIISTHSPIPLLGADKNSIILKANRTRSEGVTIERLDETIDFPNLLPNTILSSPIFGFEKIFSENKDDSKFIRVENTYSEVIANDEQDSRIETHLNKETASELLKLLKH